MQFISTTLQALWLLNRSRDLMRLHRWALRKRLYPQANYYASLAASSESGLIRIQSAAPSAIAIARVIHWINGLLFPAPRYPRRGLADLYRVKRGLTRIQTPYNSEYTIARMRIASLRSAESIGTAKKIAGSNPGLAHRVLRRLPGGQAVRTQ